ncbi:hypothetical protein ERO13_A05G266601v2 [Gossypium hirsutum]|uniref:Methyltransferase n=1 Tax=Gossypium darwinii TaxID=34276 RepID=A0A5D2GKJ2_GOSDA|nr:hypothetical protein ERO13_A05G266601v2 [Gossypium hirsutum]TYH18631.1 hypothetical protein ES288_A05G288300v1 [Gossypium darwinii]
MSFEELLPWCAEMDWIIRQVRTWTRYSKNHCWILLKIK